MADEPIAHIPGAPHDTYYSKLGHTHAGGGGGVWGSITGTLSDQTDLDNALDAKAPISHSHPESEVTNLVTDLAGKAAVSHTQAESTITNLVSDLAGKAAVSHSHPESEVTNLVTDLAGKSSTSHNHNLNDLTEKSYNSLTDKPAAVGIGYSINVQALTSSPADSVTIYFGNLPKVPQSTGGNSKVYIRKAGTIKIAEIYCYSGTAGTAEAWSLYIRKNNSTDTLIATLSVSASERVFSNAALALAVAVGDYIEIKAVNPLWATNPLTCIFGGYVYIE